MFVLLLEAFFKKLFVVPDGKTQIDSGERTLPPVALTRDNHFAVEFDVVPPHVSVCICGSTDIKCLSTGGTWRDNR